jgi:hypothetical protein
VRVRFTSQAVQRQLGVDTPDFAASRASGERNAPS